MAEELRERDDTDPKREGGSIQNYLNGMVKMKVLPSPMVDSTQMRPP